MTSGRADPFASIDVDVSDFAPRPAKRPPVPKEETRRISEANSFVSREPAAPAPAPGRRVYRTGRNVQFNTKITQETYAQAYRLLERLGPGAVLGELLEQAFAALERELDARKRK